MRHHETTTSAESSSNPSASYAIPDPSVFKNDVYLENDGNGSIRDNSRLADLGYRPELKRDFSALETFGVAFSIMGVIPSIASTIIYNLPYGGPVSMIWGWAVSSFLIMFIGLAMCYADVRGVSFVNRPICAQGADVCLYFWTHRLSPKKYRNFLAWLVGYNSFLGNVSAVSSLAWACSGIFFAAASLQDPDFTVTVYAKFGLYCGILIFCGIYCAYFTSTFARLQTPSVILNVALALVTIIGLPIARRSQLNTAQFTFGGWTNLTGWPSGFAFILSFLAPVWTICSFDCAVSISEEASNAAFAVPNAIVGAIGSAGLLGTVILIIIALTMGTDVAAINDSAIGQPLAYIYLQAFGAKGSLVIWSFMCLAQISMTASLVLPSSRQAWAFARDGALPFSGFFSHVNPSTQTPVRTVWLVVGCAIPLGLLGFADPVNESAINAIFTLAILGPYVAYGVPIASRLIWPDRFVRGPWHCGRFSRPIAAIAVVWMTFALVIFCFPGDVNPDAGSMNYAIVVMAGVWVFSIGYWFLPNIGGKTFFTGPLTHDWDAEAVAISIGVVADERDKKTDGAATPVKVQPVETLDD